MEIFIGIIFVAALYLYFKVFRWKYPIPHYKLASDTSEMITMMIILSWKKDNPYSSETDFEKYFKSLDMRAWSIEKGFKWKWSEGKDINNRVRKELLQMFEALPDSVLIENKEFIVRLVNVDEKINSLNKIFNKAA